ncbi:MAG TPA: Ig-like domain-containing protein, partial [Bryobacteraceae bacterium]|nr:Ig-like domain-containing protein [Bryobacteraceae bacterium]
LDLQAYGLSLGTHTTELVSVGEYLVLLLEPSHPGNYEQSESRMYLIDPRTGQSWLTYRSRGGNPANQPPQITITRPSSGAEFPPDTDAIDIDASTHDPDGYVRRVEFFADGLKIGETSMDFILPPPPGQSQNFSFTWREPAPGPHVLTARAIDDDNASATSQGVQIRVGASNAPAVISVYAPDSYAVEPSASATPVLDTATFRITRSGSTNAPLTVVYRLYGTAQNGVDYQNINAWVIIPAGRRSATVTVSPLADNLAEGIESIVLELILPPPIALDPSQMYTIGSQRQAAAVINDPESPGATPAASCTPVSGGLHLSFKATSGNYRVEASTDLINWETISTTAAVNDTVHFVETDRTTFPRRFYRIVPEPMPLAADQ